MKIVPIFSRNYYSNSFLAISGGQAVLFDCGAMPKQISPYLRANKAKLTSIVLTHGHFDHIATLEKLRTHYSVPVYIHENDAELLTDSYKNAYKHFFSDKFEVNPAEHTFKEGDFIPVGEERFEIIHTPGHTEGSCCFLYENHMISGDLLFTGGMGRTDFYGSDVKKMFKSLRKIYELPNADKIQLYPGHEYTTTLFDSLRYNLLID